MCGYFNGLSLADVLRSANGSLFALCISPFTNVGFILNDLKLTLFLGVSSSTKFHNGFSKAHEQCVLSPHQL